MRAKDPTIHGPPPASLKSTHRAYATCPTCGLTAIVVVTFTNERYASGLRLRWAGRGTETWWDANEDGTALVPHPCPVIPHEDHRRRIPAWHRKPLR